MKGQDMEITSGERAILLAIHGPDEGPFIDEVAGRAGVSLSTAGRAGRSLAGKGLLERRQEKRGGWVHYGLTDAGAAWLAANAFPAGTVVRDRKWGGRHTGTVVRVAGSGVFVAWHGTCTEYEMSPAELELVENPTAEQSAWRGGFGVVGTDEIIPA